MKQGWERRWYGTASLGDRLLSVPLALMSFLFGAVVLARRLLYDRGLLRAHRIPGLRVISVGNLNVGGAGKTPVVLHLARRLTARGLRCAVLSRGYGRESKDVMELPPRAAGDSLPSALSLGDEPALLARGCPEAWIFVGADRVELARRAAQRGVQVVLLDDGFQHRRLARDLDVVVMDEAVGLGNGRLLPWGPLREPGSSLRRAGLLWVREAAASRAAMPAQLPVVRARHRPSALVNFATGEESSARTLEGRAVWLLSGIARPSSFTATVESLGARVEGHTTVADHGAFPAELLTRVKAEAARRGASLLTTEKDAMRLPSGLAAQVLRLEVEITQGEDELEGQLGRVLAGL